MKILEKLFRSLGFLPQVKRKNFSGGFSDFREFTLWKKKK